MTVSQSGKPPLEPWRLAPRDQVIRLTAQLLRFFPPKEGVDPKSFATAICSVLLKYPLDVVEHACSPEGLPTAQPWTPTPYDVRKFCEAIMTKRWAAEQIAQRVAEQLRDRDDEARLARDRRQRQRIDQIEDEMAARGIYLSGWIERHKMLWSYREGCPIGGSVAAARALIAAERLKYAALPDAPPRPSQPQPEAPAHDPGSKTDKDSP